MAIPETVFTWEDGLPSKLPPQDMDSDWVEEQIRQQEKEKNDKFTIDELIDFNKDILQDFTEQELQNISENLKILEEDEEHRNRMEELRKQVEEEQKIKDNLMTTSIVHAYNKYRSQNADKVSRRLQMAEYDVQFRKAINEYNSTADEKYKDEAQDLLITMARILGEVKF